MRGWAWPVVMLLAACGGGGGSSLPHGGGVPSPTASAGTPQVPSFVAIGPLAMTNGGIPSSGKVNAFAQDPANPQTLYVAGGRGTGLETYTGSGVYRTTNFGQTWQAFDIGLTDSGGLTSSVVNALWMDASHPANVLAATDGDGIFLSTSGSSWHNVFRTTQATQFASFGGQLFASTAVGVIVSSDGGATWQYSLASVQATALGTAGGALYAGTATGAIYAYGAGTWSQVGSVPFSAATGTNGSSPGIHQIAVDPLTPATLYASSNDGTWNQRLAVSTDGGHSWNVLVGASEQTGLGPQAIAFSLTTPHLLYVGSDSVFFSIPANGSTDPTPGYLNELEVVDVRDIWVVPTSPLGGESCWVAADQGLDWVSPCYNAAPPGDTIVSAPIAMGLARRLAISPSGSTVLASMQDFNAHVSFNGGSTWQETGLYEDGFVELRPGNANVCFDYDETGFYTSSDGCHTFVPSPGVTVTSERTMPQPIAFDPTNPLHMYVASGTDPAASSFLPGGPTGIFASTDGGATFAQLAWPFTNPGTVSVDRVNADHIVVGDLADGGSSLWVSFDGGASWAKSTGVPASPFWYAVTISPVDGQTVLATSADNSNTVYVLRSTDGGRTFTSNSTVVANAARLRGYRETKRMPYFAYSPVREIRFNQDVTSGTPAAVLTTIAGAFLSADDGQSWQRVDQQLIAHSFWGTRWINGYLYLASDGQGVLRSANPVQTP